MGRSRLAYRFKHKGILSENSRKKIQEAKTSRKLDNMKQTKEEEELPPIDYEDPIEEEMDEGDVDVLTVPKLYYLDNEYSEYIKEIHLEERYQSPLLYVVFCLYSMI